MKRLAATLQTICTLIIAASLLLSAGCNMCCPGYLDDYATVGGKWARAHPSQGRVGSAFSDPGTVSPASAAGYVHGESNFVDSQVEFPMGEEIQVIEDSETSGDTIILGEGW